ncbi:MAG TPA: hypothetical protein VGR02_02310 [Thermoanaerobaculia bacterium]|nr:hypothetical protein [Thermoanaerobaculia bacterium]
MKKLLLLAIVLLALAAPSAFACSGCVGYACDGNWSAWCREHFDYCEEGGGCGAAPQAAAVTPFTASWKVASIQRLEPKARTASVTPKLASLAVRKAVR